MKTGIKNKNWPTFIIIGAGKSGTTSLYRHLAEHPEVFMSPKKEPNFFAFEGKQLDFRGPRDDAAKNRSITTKDEYLELFSGVRKEKAIGEASPVYIYSEMAAERIHHYLPDAKLVAILRQPVDRAYSAFMMMVRTGRESCGDFKEVLQDQARRQNENWGSATLLEEGYYFKLVSRYYKLFDKSQIKIFLFEDIVNDISNVYSSLCEFIEVNPQLGPETFHKHNVSGLPRSRWLHSWTSKSGGIKELGKLILPKSTRASIKEKIRKNNLIKVPIDKELRKELTTIYEEDILNLQTLIGRDLTHWLR